MGRRLLVLLLGALVVAGPYARLAAAQGDDDVEYDDGLDDEGDEDDASQKINDVDVVVLGEGNFTSTVSATPFALVEFWAPWCGHCQKLAPIYGLAATELKDLQPGVIIAKVDVTKHGELAKEFHVHGYPTLKWFVDGEQVGDFNGERDAESIVTWVRRRTGPVAVAVDSPEALAEVEKEADVVSVGYFKDFEGPEYKAFKVAAKKTDDVTYVQTTNPDVAAAAGLTSAPGVSMVTNFLGEPRDVVVFQGELDEGALRTFWMGEKIPLTIEFNTQTQQKIFAGGIYMQVIFWGAPSDFAPDSEPFRTLRTVAKQFRGRVVFVTANNANESSQPITEYFQLSGQMGPVVLGFMQQGNRRATFKGDPMDAAALRAFTMQVLDGSAFGVDMRRTQPPPEEPYEEGVAVVVGANFKEVVLNPDKDVLLEVYAPWCGACKQLAPMFSQLAQRFAGVDSVVVAKMDGTENDVAGVEATSYPTLLFFPANPEQSAAKEPVTFTGDPNLESLTQFIRDNAKVPFTLEAAKEEL